VKSWSLQSSNRTVKPRAPPGLSSQCILIRFSLSLLHFRLPRQQLFSPFFFPSSRAKHDARDQDSILLRFIKIQKPSKNFHKTSCTVQTGFSVFRVALGARREVRGRNLCSSRPKPAWKCNLCLRSWSGRLRGPLPRWLLICDPDVIKNS
jgi:hypothetical protein